MKILVLLWLVLFPVINFAQSIEGFVYDETGSPIENVNVYWVKSGTGTSSDNMGHFSLGKSNYSNDTLVFTHISFHTEQISTAEIDYSSHFGIVLISASSNMNEFVYTASRNLERRNNSPSKITVINYNEIQQMPLLNADDALIYSSGLIMDRAKSIFSDKSVVTMRGLSGNEQGRTMVLVDGIPINKSDGGTVNFHLINPDLIERIEVLKGPASALYGGNAMGGVINFITRTPDKPFKLNFSGSYATYNTFDVALYVSGFFSKKEDRGFFYTASMLYQNSDGYISEPEYMQTEYTVPIYLHEKLLTVQTGYQFNRTNKIMLTSLFFDDERGGGETVYEELGSYSEHDSYHFRLNYKGSIKKWNITANTFVLRENYAKVNEYMKSGDYTLYDVDSKRSDRGIIAFASRTVGTKRRFTGGFDYHYGEVDAADVYRTSTDKIINAGKLNIMAVFSQYEQSVLPKLKLVAGIRYDYAAFSDGRFSVEMPSPAMAYMLSFENDSMPDNYWHAISPKIALKYNIGKDDYFYISYSQGFRSPILDDLCRSGRTRGCFQMANPGLTPERLINYELGFSFNKDSKWQIEPSIYYSLGYNFMYTVSNGDTIDMGYPAPVLFVANVSEVQILGAELDLRFQLNDQWQLFANYAFAHSTILKYEPDSAGLSDITGNYLSNVPDHLVNAGFTFLYEKFAFNSDFRYVGERWVNDTNTEDDKYGIPPIFPAYFTINLKAAYQITSSLQVSFSVFNITNSIYTDGKGQLCPGRMMMFTLKYKM